MSLDPSFAQAFAEGYRQILLMAYSKSGLSGHRTPKERMLAVRRQLCSEVELLDEVLESLAFWKGVFPDPKVVAAIRTVDLGTWIYLRDLPEHAILLHPEGWVGYGLAPIGPSLRSLAGGTGRQLRTAIMAVDGHFFFDGLVEEVQPIGAEELARHEGNYQEMVASGTFHTVPKKGFLKPQLTRAPRPTAPTPRPAPRTRQDQQPTGTPLAGPATPRTAATPRRTVPPPKTGPMPKGYQEAMQIKVTLADIEPLIWRRLVVPVDCTLARLHLLFQSAFGWQDRHFHRFTIQGATYEPLDGENERGVRDERIGLVKAGLWYRTRFEYRYDFGDRWIHQALVEGLLLLEKPARVPLCAGGARACPPEDCGGAPGYLEMLASLRDPTAPRRHEILRWLGREAWDAEAFDVEQANAAIHKAYARRRKPGAR